MINAIQYARENKVPYFGICLGMQTMVIEYARNVCGLERADSSEFDPGTPHRVIYKLRELKGVDEAGRHHAARRLAVHLEGRQLRPQVLRRVEISERHRHRYEFNREIRRDPDGRGPANHGETPDRTYVEICEIGDHPWYLGCQFILIQIEAARAASAVPVLHRRRLRASQETVWPGLC
jgi:CTP synthase